jgi:hypothetical protein
MKENRLVIKINKPVSYVFHFVITPPNSTLWIPDVVKEETNELPVKRGTVYFLSNEKGETSKVTVVNFKNNKYIEWISKDKNYHCNYTLLPISENLTEFRYYEYVDMGNIDKPFTQQVLEKLKKVLEK